MKIYTIFLYFVIYAFLGWTCESIYVSFFRKKIVNSGFLNGPLCPIYGFGAISIVFFLQPFIDYPLIVFLFGVISTSLLEYFTSWLMEVCFNMRWWDYSKHKYNIKGRICLLNSSLFGIMSLVLMYVVHPFTNTILNKISNNIQILLAILFLILILIDFFVSTISVLNVNRSLQKVHDFLHAIYENKIEPHSEKLIAENEVIIKKLIKRKERLMKSFPDINIKKFDLKSINLNDIIEKLKEATKK